MFAARVFARITASGVNFGVTNSSAVAPVYGATNFNKNQTYLIIVKYTISTGGNDPVSIWVLSAGVPASEAAAGAPEATNAASLGQDVIDAIALRQGSGTTSTQQVVDAIRVGTTWADIAGGAPPAATTSPRTFIARLTGAAERPNPVPTNAYGFGRVTLNDAENQITVSANWENLTSNTISGHIHGNATTEQTAGILFDLAPPTGATSGSVTNKTFAVTAQQVADLRAGLWYINIHSQNFQAGEIRGQLVPPTQVADFNGDGITDYAVLRASGNSLQWWISNNGSANTDQVVTWGILSDFPAPGDYDGDRKADIAVFRNGGATPGFYILQSSTSTVRFVRFGQSVTDQPVVADYDGDGRDNVAIYRNAQTPGGQSVFWYFGDVGAVANQQVPVPWGTAGDFPVPGDYNGDGRADFTVFRNVNGSGVFFTHPSNGTFDFNNNTGNMITHFGLGSDGPVWGDYDGDGISDPAVVRTEAGAITWYIRPSSGNGSYFGLSFGAATDLLVQGDYDGDGKTDPSTYRNTAPVTFFSRGSATGNTIVRQYGATTDQPVINGSLSNFRPEFID